MKKILFALAIMLCCGFMSCTKQKTADKPITKELNSDEREQYTELFETDFNVNSVDVIGAYDWASPDAPTGVVFVKQNKTFGDYLNETVKEYVNDLLNTPASKLSTYDKMVIDRLNIVTYADIYTFFKKKTVLEHQLYSSREWKEYEKKYEEFYKSIGTEISTEELAEMDNGAFGFMDELEHRHVEEPLKQYNEDMWWMYYVYQWNVLYKLEENIHPYLEK